MDFLQKFTSFAKAAAPTVANLVMPGSGPLVHTIMRQVTGDPDTAPIEDVAKKFDRDPKLFLEFKRLVVDREIRLAEIESGETVAVLTAVNETMQAEAKSEHWPQWSWRPFNGFLFGSAIVCIYFILPIVGKEVPTVPQSIWIGWGAILGVTTWDRGKEKRSKAGDQQPGFIEGAIKAIRGK